MFKVKGIIIDLDGTLVDSRDAYKEAFKKALEAFGVTSFDPKIALEVPKRLEQGLPIADLVPVRDIKKFLSKYLETYYSITEIRSKPLPGVYITLEKLSEKAKLALLTMRHVPKDKVLRELEKFNLSKYFKCIVTALDTSTPKPSPEPVLKCARRLGLEACECLVAGDSISDIKAGKLAGAKTVAFFSGIFSMEELEREKPDLILENINALPAFVE